MFILILDPNAAEKISECNDAQLDRCCCEDTTRGGMPQAVEHDALSLGLVDVFPGLAGSHPATTHVVERDVLSQQTTCSGDIRQRISLREDLYEGDDITSAE